MLRLAAIADPHLAPAGTPPAGWHNPYSLDSSRDLFRIALRRAVEHRADAVALLGDLSHLGDEDSTDDALRLAAEVDRPILVVGGNHDLNRGPDHLPSAVVRLALPMLSMVGWHGVKLGPSIEVVGVPLTMGQSVYGARPGDGLPLSWPDIGTTVVLSHYPIISLSDRLAGANLVDAGDLENVARLQAPLFAHPGPVIVLHGHLHTRATSAAGGLLQLSCAALVEPPFELAIIDLVREGGDLLVRRRSEAVRPTSAAKLPVLSPAEEAWRFSKGGWSFVTEDPGLPPTERLVPRSALGGAVAP